MVPRAAHEWLLLLLLAARAASYSAPHPLVALYTATGGSSWSNNTGWLDQRDPCDWHGIDCSADRNITAISLFSNGLVGTIPSEISQLRALVRLNVNQTTIVGTVPPSLSQLRAMQHLDLTMTSLSGSVPSELVRLSALEFLSIAFTSLSGTVPPSLSQLVALQTLYLSETALSGTLPPQELSHLSKLQRLYLSRTSLSGSVPLSLSRLSALERLYLDGTALSGTLPRQLSSLGRLQQLFVDTTSLSGSLPPQVSRLGQLQRLSLYQMPLAGTLPPALSQMSKLQVLDMHTTLLSGSLPPDLSMLSELQRLYMFQTALSGTLPSEISMLSELQRLYLYRTGLSGSLPEELARLSTLQRLYLSTTSLSGTVPSEMPQLSALDKFDVYATRLSGTLPPALSRLERLSNLALSQTSLSGTLPPELSSLGAMRELYLAQMALSGTLPSEWAQLSSLQRLTLWQNALSGVIPPQLAALNGSLKYCVLAATQLDQPSGVRGFKNFLTCQDAAEVPLACRSQLPCLTPPPLPPPPPLRCTNVCPFANNGLCEDGGAGNEYAACELGTDCDDCNIRVLPRQPPPPPAPPPPPPARPPADGTAIGGTIGGAIAAVVVVGAGIYVWRTRRDALGQRLRLIELQERHQKMDVCLGGGAESIDLRSYVVDVFTQMGVEVSPLPTPASADSRKSGKAPNTFSPVCRRFSSTIQELHSGNPQDAALGITHYMRASPAQGRAGMARGCAEIEAEFEAFVALVDSMATLTEAVATRPWWASMETAEEARECMHYCIHDAAGSSTTLFSNARHPRDCDESGALRDDRKTAAGEGMRLADFCTLPEVYTAKLEAPHVAALRIYTTAAFKVLNGPLRTPWDVHPHPFPVTVAFLTGGIQKLRAVGASAANAHGNLDLWRGMQDVSVSDEFLAKGGTELAPMSTTSALKVAVAYSEAATSLIFKLRTDSFMARGAEIKFLSAFPSEDECLFPPLTYLRPTGKTEHIECIGRQFTVVEVVPHFGTA